ncbi:MAG TPA: SDR family NAD(P)-dependent oxidoreductase [Solirubrobacteraceae bacterium]|nr:SDR family NAD(P)-dependent oxidoreductase [Solirubrobacteraceae bacterium]
MRVSGSSILLTGATGGLGGAIAHALAAREGRLVLTGRRADRLEVLARELDGRAVIADLSDSSQVDELLAQAGEIDVLVANAGLPAAAPLERLTREEADRVLDVNLRAPVALAHALLPGMLARGRGHLVFMSSTGGKVCAPGNPLYHATKFGLRGLAGALRIDLHGTGVSASCVLPGFIRDAGLYAESGAKLPFGVGTRTPNDVGAAVVRAIERDLAEVQVTTLALRAGALLWNTAPDLASSISRLMGSQQIARTCEQALADKR